MTTRQKRLKRLRNFQIATEWPLVEKFYKSELESVLNHIADKNVNSSIKTSLRKYLIISCVSLIDVFLSHLIQRSIDKYKIHISRIVGKTTEREANRDRILVILTAMRLTLYLPSFLRLTKSLED